MVDHDIHRIPPYLLAIYLDTLFGVLFTYLLDMAYVQSGRPPLSASQALFFCFLLATGMHLTGKFLAAFMERLLSGGQRAAATNGPAATDWPAATAEFPPIWISDAINGEADEDEFWDGWGYE